jgi:hypothetical protein
MRRPDLIAGLSVAGLMLPEAVAYAGIAGLPPQRAIFAAIAGCLVYATVGRSRFAIVSATSSSAAILAATLAALPRLHLQAHHPRGAHAMTHDFEPLLNPVEIATLRPTQMTVGLREVARKRAEWRKHAEHDGDAFLGRHMIPVVLVDKV